MKTLNLFKSLFIVVLLLGVSESAWGGSSPTTTMRTISTNTADGLVYMTKSTTSAPALNAYKAQSNDMSQLRLYRKGLYYP